MIPQLTLLSCPLYLESNVTATFLKNLSLHSKDGIILVTDTTVATLPFYQQEIVPQDFYTIIIPAGETTKTWQQVEIINEKLAQVCASRNTALVAIGGGVVSDIAGFAASIYRRGMPFHIISTTLLGQIDAAIGGKNGVNTAYGKNAMGTFYFPTSILIDTFWLESQTSREFCAGLAEMVKYGLIADAQFFQELEQNADKLLVREPSFLRKAILRCCEIKAKIVEQDEKEQYNQRYLLNFGHTLGHALEAATHYQHYLHGEAVAIGMVHAARLSQKQGFISAHTLQRIITLLEKMHLPTTLPANISSEELQVWMKHDKKNESQVTKIVLLQEIGVASVYTDLASDALIL